MSAPDWNTTITIRNRHFSPLSIESVTATGGAPTITAPGEIPARATLPITSAAANAGVGTQGSVQYSTKDGGDNTVQIWFDFACNNNNVTANPRASRNTVQIVRTNPPSGTPLGNPLNVTFDVVTSS